MTGLEPSLDTSGRGSSFSFHFLCVELALCVRLSWAFLGDCFTSRHKIKIIIALRTILFLKNWLYVCLSTLEEDLNLLFFFIEFWRIFWLIIGKKSWWKNQNRKNSTPNSESHVYCFYFCILLLFWAISKIKYLIPLLRHKPSQPIFQKPPSEMRKAWQ